jgi:hypothetical protein
MSSDQYSKHAEPTDTSEYVVEWYADIEAESPEDAAEKALRMQRRPGSIATVFAVFEGDENGRADEPVAEVDLSSVREDGAVYDPAADMLAILRSVHDDSETGENPDDWDGPVVHAVPDDVMQRVIDALARYR